MSDELDKELNEALGGGTAARKSTAKQTLRTPPLVAEPAPELLPQHTHELPQHGHVISDAPRESEQEMYLRIKGEVLDELLKKQKEGANILAEVAAKEKAEEDMAEFHVNLPVQAANIRIDGREYYHGHTYKIRASQMSTFLDIQASAWRHDETVQGHRKHAGGARTGNMSINGNGQMVPIGPIYN